MPGNAAVKLTMRTVDALSTENRDALHWDRDLPGFGVRVYRTGRKVCIVQARGPAGHRRDLRAHRATLHRAVARPSSALRGGPLARLGAALQDARQALPGEPDGERAGQDVPACGSLGHACAAAQPVPVGASLQGASPRAVTHARGVPAPRAGARRGGGRRLGVCLGGCR